MILLDEHADTFPVGLAETPFDEVYRALRIVAAAVWNVDPLAYRAGMAWGWYALHAPSSLTGFRDVVTAALISAIAPMVKDTQTDSELVEYLRQWRSYTPTFQKLQAIYALFGVVADIQPISDPEGQALLPVDDTRLAFYVFVLSMDWARPMLLGEIAETARRASPLGARPFVVYLVDGLVSVPVAIAPTDGFLWVDVWESAVPVAPPAPTLPTVTAHNGVIGTISAQGTQTVPNGSSVYQYIYSNGAYHLTVVDASVVLAVQRVTDSSAQNATYYGFTAERTQEGYIKITNNTGATYANMYGALVRVCSDSTATVVTVYNASNVAYNAFKFTASGTDYYYVLDGTQTDWTDDLASIGYSLTPVVVLPTVSYIGRFIYSGGGLSAGAIGTLRDSNNNTIAYNTGVSYAVYWYASSNWVYGDVSYVSLVNESGLLKVKNISSTYISIYFVSTYECSSNQATVVTVYNSSNVAYNAFKFTASGTDYYYVLDGTQADWTDDLESIGYSLTKTYFRGWFNQNKTDQYVSYTSRYVLYDDNGSTIPASSDAANYWGVAKCRSDGTVVSSAYFRGFESSDGVLRWFNSGGGTTVAYLLYSHTDPRT